METVIEEAQEQEQNQNPAREVPSFYTVEKFCEKHSSWATVGGIRHLLFNRSENGLDRAVVRLGHKLLIDEREFFLWAETQRERPRDEDL